MEITNEMALEIAQNAGDLHMKEGGRDVWSEQDAQAATAVYEQLKSIIQKMDEPGAAHE